MLGDLSLVALQMFVFVTVAVICVVVSFIGSIVLVALLFVLL